MTGDRLDAAVDRYLQAAAMNVAPPLVSSDPLVDGATPTEQLLRVLGLAANTGDPTDMAESADGHAVREAWTSEAAGAFAGQDAGAASQLGTVMSIAGMVGGTVAGILAPVAQIPGQLSQGAQQAVQAATALFGASTPDGPGVDTTVESESTDSVDATDAGDPDAALGNSGFSDGAAASDATIPTAVLGPAPVPSAATYPSASPAIPPSQAAVSSPPPITSPAMTGVPMVPPTGPANTGAESKADTKRITAPAVRNGAPVQGRITTPASGPVVTTRIDGKPVAARRIRADAAPEEP